MMPPVNKKSTTKVPDRRVIYPEVELHKLYGPSAIDYDRMRAILGWEGEDDYKARTGNDLTAELEVETEGGEKYYPLVVPDGSGEKLAVCWNNCSNREFRESKAEAYCQDLLNKNWAGPSCMGNGDQVEGIYGGDKPWKAPDGKVYKPGQKILLPAVTVNGETIILSRTGLCHSIQHRGVGYVWACQRWLKDRKKWPGWPAMPVLDAILVTGVSEDPRVVRTIDNVVPRSLGDVYYTSELFRLLPPKAKKECSRMMAKAIDLLWLRTGAGGAGKDRVYQTHSESMEFEGRHQRLRRCVKHIWTENQERALSLPSMAHLSPGACSALMYLMAASDSDGDAYRNGDPPGEKTLNWDAWDKAEEFWVLLIASEDFAPVRDALGALHDLGGGRPAEKHFILTKAWQAFAAGQPITSEDLSLEGHYAKDPKTGIERLVDVPDLGGIDLGERGELGENGAPTAPAEEEIAADATAIREQRAKDDEEAIAAAKPKPPTVIKPGLKGGIGGLPVNGTPKGGKSEIVKEHERLKARYEGYVLLIKGPVGWTAYGADAATVAVALGGGEPIASPDGLDRFNIDKDDIKETIAALQKADHAPLLVEFAGGKPVVTDPAEAPKKKGKATAAR
jgi:hypothetical protein